MASSKATLVLLLVLAAVVAPAFARGGGSETAKVKGKVFCDKNKNGVYGDPDFHMRAAKVKLVCLFTKAGSPSKSAVKYAYTSLTGEYEFEFENYSTVYAGYVSKCSVSLASPGAYARGCTKIGKCRNPYGLPKTLSAAYRIVASDLCYTV